MNTHMVYERKLTQVDLWIEQKYMFIINMKISKMIQKYISKYFPCMPL